MFALQSEGQTGFETLMKAGKAEFNKSDSQGFANAVEIFTSATKANPASAEAYYFLGYAYSRLNQFYAENIYKANLELTIKSSESFEKAIQISPKYKGEIVVLDPHSKITSEWGTLAFKYLYIDKYDSAIWALKEGRSRGGFGIFFIESLKLFFDQCPQNSYFFMSGDNVTFNVLYTQLIEKHRTDIRAIDNQMLGTKWYSSILQKYFSSSTDLKNLHIDTCCFNYQFPDTINIAEYVITPIDDEDTITPIVKRSSCILYRLLKNDGFKSNVFFCDGYGKEPLGMTKFTTNYLGMKTIDIIAPAVSTEEQYSVFKKFLSIEPLLNQNNRNEVQAFNNIRIGILSSAAELYFTNKKAALALFKLVEKNFKSQKTPSYKELDDYFLEIKAYINQ